MEKLPVFRTAGRAIGFTLWNCFTIFRLGWLPIALLFGTQIGLSALIMHADGQTLAAVPNPFFAHVLLEKFWLLNVVSSILQALAIAAVAVSIHRVILFDDRKPGEYFNFGFGKTEFLYIVMGFLTGLMMVAVLAAFFSSFAFFASGGDLTGLFKKFSDNPEAAASIVTSSLRGNGLSVFLALYFVMWVLLVYLSVRLAVWPPAIVATNRLSPSEPWQLTRGNVWRFIGAAILTFGWIYVFILAPVGYWYYKSKMQMPPPDVPAITEPASSKPTEPAAPMPTPAEPTAVTPPKEAAPAATTAAPAQSEAAPAQPVPEAAPTAPPPATPSPDAAPPDMKKLNLPDGALGAILAPFALILWVAFIFIYVFFTALAVALMSFSYKALKGYEAHEPIPDEG